MDLSKLIHGFSKLLHGFVRIGTLTSLSCYTDQSKLFYLYLLPFARQNQAKVWPIFQSFLKLLLWTKGVEWVKLALGLLCLRQYFLLKPRQNQYKAGSQSSADWISRKKGILMKLVLSSRFEIYNIYILFF